MDSPLFSIVIPVYNAERYLQGCLDSIMVQREPRFEVVLVDDGSSDASFSILTHQAEQDPRFKVFHRGNQGPLAARRFAIEQAIGFYVIFVDADDFIAEDMLSDLAAEIDEYAHDMFIYRFNVVEQDGLHPVGSKSHFPDGTVFSGVEKSAIYAKVLEGAFHSLWIKAIKRRLLIEDPTDFPSLGRMSYAEDMVMSLHPLTHANSIKYLDRPYCMYRKNPTSLVKTFNRHRIKDIQLAFQLLLQVMPEWGLGERGEQLFVDAYVSAVITILNSAIFTGVPGREFRSIVSEFMQGELPLGPYLKNYTHPVGTDRLGKFFPVFAGCIRYNVLGLYYFSVRSLVVVYSYARKLFA